MFEIDELADDPEIAFTQYAKMFDSQFLHDSSEDDSNNYYDICMRYMVSVLAAASALDLEILEKWEIPENNNMYYSYFQKFRQDVQFYVIRTEIQLRKDFARYSVGLSSEQKDIIYSNIDKIRGVLEQANLGKVKLEQLQQLLNKFRHEIEQDRTKFSRISDFVRRLAGLSSDLEETGIRPYFNYIKAIYGVIDDAKEVEIERIPEMPKKKKLPPPPRRIEDKGEDSDAKNLDDEIPF